MSHSSNDSKDAISDTDKPTVKHVDTAASLEKNTDMTQWDAVFEKKTMCVPLLLMFSCMNTDGATRRRRVDRRILPILGFCYAISLIDRSNLSVARISGMGDDLVRPPWQMRPRYLITNLCRACQKGRDIASYRSYTLFPMLYCL
jgi:hypothetical protein